MSRAKSHASGRVEGDRLAAWRRLSRRGRLTLLGLAVSALAWAVWGALRLDFASPGADSSRPIAQLSTGVGPSWPGSWPELAAVSSGPEADDVMEPSSHPPPLSVLERVPSGPDAFARAAAQLTPSDDAGSPALPADAWLGRPTRIVEWVEVPPHRSDLEGPLRVEYTMDVDLSRRIFRVLRRARVPHGHVIVLEPSSGRIIAYASTDPENFPGSSAYPAASLVKVITAAAALEKAPGIARRPCIYRGSPYRLSRSRVHPPPSGRETTFERSLATSNNQCFAQLAVGAVGGEAMLAAIERFGWLDSPAPGHAPGSATLGDDDYDLGRLGSGLAGSRITPLHAAQLAATLAAGELVEPWWIERVADARGRVLPLPKRALPGRVIARDLADELRGMLVRTTTKGTARSAFRDRRGRPKLGEIRVAGKTGNLTGTSPPGRYEWFIGVAPAEAPSVAVAVLQLQADLWWSRSSEIAADVLSEIFCVGRECRPALARRYASVPIEAQLRAPVVVSEPFAGGRVASGPAE